MAGTIAIALLVAMVGSPAVVAAQEPGEPITFYGSAVDAEGAPAPEGTEIVAAVDGEAVDRVAVDEPGVFAGDDPTEAKLRTHTRAGETVTFHVDSVDGPRAAETHEIEESGFFEVELTFPAGTFAPPPDDGAPPPQPAPGAAPGVPPAGTPTPEAPPPAPTTPETPTPETGPVEVIDDPEAIGELVDLPEGATPTRAERSPLVADEGVGGSTAAFTRASPVERVTFHDAVEGDVTVTEVEPSAGADAPGEVVAVVDISVPEGAEDASATVRMRVSRDRVDELDADPSALRISHNVDGEWVPLETSVVEEADDVVVLEVETPGFSLFAVSVVDAPVPDDLDVETILLASVLAVGVVAALVGALFLGRRRTDGDQ